MGSWEAGSVAALSQGAGVQTSVPPPGGCVPGRARRPLSPSAALPAKWAQ